MASSASTVAADGDAQAGEQAADAGEPGVVGRGGSGEGWCSWCVHAWTLTLESNFKSSGRMDEAELTIGEVARRAGVATSTIRYYERVGLLEADARRSGQRRFREATLRRLVFIGMLQDAGLSLDDIAGVLAADDVAEWKAIATPAARAVLDEEIERLNERPRLPQRRADLPVRPPGHRLQGDGRRDRPPAGLIPGRAARYLISGSRGRPRMRSPIWLRLISRGAAGDRHAAVHQHQHVAHHRRRRP